MDNLVPPDSDDEQENFFDDVSNSLNQFSSSQLLTPEVKPWDMFRVLPPEADRSDVENEALIAKVLRFVKLLVCLLVFALVLGCGVVAKGAVFFMTSQLRADQQVKHCNRELDVNREKTFVASLPESERVAWVWVLLFALMVPEVGSLLRAMRICFFKSWRRPPPLDFAVVLVMETCHAVGVSLLAFSVLPDLDVVKAAMITNCVCFVPGVLGLLSEEGREQGEHATRKTLLRMFVDVLALAAQATGFVVWPLLEGRETPSLWLVPLAVLLTSCGWWENYVTKHSSIGFLKGLSNIKERLKKSRYYIYMFTSIWKMICFFVSMMIIWNFRKQSVPNLFNKFYEGFSAHKIIVQEVRTLPITEAPDLTGPQPGEEVLEVEAWFNTPLWVLLIQVMAAYLCFVVGKYACRIMIQGFSYALPVTLTVPVTVSTLIVFCGVKNSDPCAFEGVIPGYLFFREPAIYFLSDFITKQHAWIWLLWLASQAWITMHIWWPKCERLASTEKIFVSPMYSALLVDQSLALNRRIDDEADVRTEDLLLHPTKRTDDYLDTVSMRSDVSSARAAGHGNAASDGITRIFACATMWHETKDEMMEILKSIFRMDEDQSARRVAQKYLQVADPDYYEFETHVFFDDAFVPCDSALDDGALANSFVKTLVATIDEAASHVHETHVRMRAPKKFPTPYGGKLVWTLPGKTKMIVHLKDKAKIRHKKRWSQVMYMYYLLGHRLMELAIPAERKEVIAENTYILALDGDIDFQPQAVQLLVDLMKKNRQLGAACGRIHPIGSGAMVWYQRFEYAIGHWLQKATEHMIGCVLCSPGCFSLFRGKALMDDNVMRKYTTRSEEARHYVQYDQGEDRWLCTLLLQRGYRVEYSAASDAYTHCPEGFGEFYNQRRRWVPSTMANIMDLLADYKKTVRVNDNISALYMAYQTLLLGGSVLGPGTILLMLVGAFVAAFKMDQWTSFAYNIVPIVFFMIICYFTKSETQLTIAMIISTVYGMVMIAVLVGIMMQISEDGPLAPSSLFFFIVAAQMIFTALLHPREIGCLPFGVIYYITVPSMYMLLIIYSLFNLNNVSWGTREVPQVQRKSAEDLEREQREAEEAKNKKKKGTIMGFLSGLRTKAAPEEEGSLEFSLAGLFKCMCCTYPKVIDEKQQLMRIADTLELLNRRMENIERTMEPQVNAPLGSRRRSFGLLRMGKGAEPLGALAEDPAEGEEQPLDMTDSEDDTTITEPKHERDDLINPYWMEDPDLKKGEVDFISTEEEQFWKDLVDKYLYPLDDNKQEKDRIVKDLKALRDKTVFGFFMLNAMFVMILFLIQLNKELLHLNWPLGVKSDISFNQGTEEIMIAREYLELEPIGMVFLLSFAVILLIQFIAMLFHRFGTLSHILAGTELGWYCTKKVEDISTDALIDRHAVEIAKELQRLHGLYEEEEKKDKDGETRRFTIMQLEENSKKKQHVGSLANAFKHRMKSISANPEGAAAPAGLRRLTQRRGTMDALRVRRNSVLASERRRSSMRGLGSVASVGSEEASDRMSAVLPRRTESIVSWRDMD